MLRDIPEKRTNFIKISKDNVIKRRIMRLFVFWMRKHLNAYLFRSLIGNTKFVGTLERNKNSR